MPLEIKYFKIIKEIKYSNKQHKQGNTLKNNHQSLSVNHTNMLNLKYDMFTWKIFNT